MPREILIAEIGRMEATKQALCGVIERVRPEMYSAYSAIPDAAEVHEARDQLRTDIGMLTSMQAAIIREIDAQIARMRQMISMDPDIQQLPLWLDDMSLEEGAGDRPAARNEHAGNRDAARNEHAGNRDAARNQRVARNEDAIRNHQIEADAQFAAALDGVQDEEECPVCLNAPGQCVLPCGHRMCFGCIGAVVEATPVVDGVRHVPCPFCRKTFSSEDDIHALQDFRGQVYAQLPKQDMLGMQRLLLKL